MLNRILTITAEAGAGLLILGLMGMMITGIRDTVKYWKEEL